MSKIKLLLLLSLSYSLSVIANIGEGIQLISTGEIADGARHLERYFEDASSEDQAKIAIILSRLKKTKMENSPIYYTKFALKFLSVHLSKKEKTLLHIELGDYNLSIGNLPLSQKYYENAMELTRDTELINYINYRLAWVNYNNDKKRMAYNFLMKSLVTKKAKMREDSLYLLGKLSLEIKINFRSLLGRDILETDWFIKGINESEKTFKMTRIDDQYSRFYLSVNKKIQNNCEVLGEDLNQLPAELEIDTKKLGTFFKTCLVKDKKLASTLLENLSRNKWINDFREVTALAYYMTGENAKSCRLYQKLFKEDLTKYKGISLSCELDKIDFNSIVKVSTSCNESDLYSNINENIIGKLLLQKHVYNQALLYAAIESNIKTKHFSHLQKKLVQCNKVKKLVAQRVLIDNEKIVKTKVSDFYNKRCQENDQYMLMAMYLKYSLGDTKLKTGQKKCLNSRLDFASKKEILLSIDLKKYKGNCSFEFDCTIKKLSNYVLHGQRISNEKAQKSFMNFYWRLNQLQNTSSLIKKRIKASDLEKIYLKITTVKKLFIKPAFYNESLMQRASTDYNNLITRLMTKVDSLSELEQDQKDLLKNSLSNERVIL